MFDAGKALFTRTLKAEREKVASRIAKLRYAAKVKGLEAEHAQAFVSEHFWPWMATLPPHRVPAVFLDPAARVAKKQRIRRSRAGAARRRRCARANRRDGTRVRGRGEITKA